MDEVDKYRNDRISFDDYRVVVYENGDLDARQRGDIYEVVHDRPVRQIETQAISQGY